MSRAYYYDRETEQILERVEHVDGDASDQWTKAMSLLQQHLQPMTSAFLKANLGEMFEFVVCRPLPWTPETFVEVLQHGTRTFEELQIVGGLKFHTRQLEALVKRQGSGPASFIETFQLIAVMRSIMNVLPDGTPSEVKEVIGSEEIDVAEEMLKEGKRVIHEEYREIKNMIQSKAQLREMDYALPCYDEERRGGWNATMQDDRRGGGGDGGGRRFLDRMQSDPGRYDDRYDSGRDVERSYSHEHSRNDQRGYRERGRDDYGGNKEVSRDYNRGRDDYGRDGHSGMRYNDRGRDDYNRDGYGREDHGKDDRRGYSDRRRDDHARDDHYSRRYDDRGTDDYDRGAYNRNLKPSGYQDRSDGWSGRRDNYQDSTPNYGRRDYRGKVENARQCRTGDADGGDEQREREQLGWKPSSGSPRRYESRQYNSFSPERELSHAARMDLPKRPPPPSGPRGPRRSGPGDMPRRGSGWEPSYSEPPRARIDEDRRAFDRQPSWEAHDDSRFQGRGPASGRRHSERPGFGHQHSGRRDFERTQPRSSLSSDAEEYGSGWGASNQRTQSSGWGASNQQEVQNSGWGGGTNQQSKSSGWNGGTNQQSKSGGWGGGTNQNEQSSGWGGGSNSSSSTSREKGGRREKSEKHGKRDKEKKKTRDIGTGWGTISEDAPDASAWAAWGATATNTETTTDALPENTQTVNPTENVRGENPNSSVEQNAWGGNTAATPEQNAYGSNTAPIPENAWGGNMAAVPEQNAYGSNTAPIPENAWGGKTAAVPEQTAWGGNKTAVPEQTAWGGNTAATPEQTAWGGNKTAVPEQTAWGGNTAATPEQTAWGGNTAATPEQTAWGGSTAATPEQNVWGGPVEDVEQSGDPAMKTQSPDQSQLSFDNLVLATPQAASVCKQSLPENGNFGMTAMATTQEAENPWAAAIQQDEQNGAGMAEIKDLPLFQNNPVEKEDVAQSDSTTDPKQESENLQDASWNPSANVSDTWGALASSAPQQSAALTLVPSDLVSNTPVESNAWNTEANINKSAWNTGDVLCKAPSAEPSDFNSNIQFKAAPEKKADTSFSDLPSLGSASTSVKRLGPPPGFEDVIPRSASCPMASTQVAEAQMGLQELQIDEDEDSRPPGLGTEMDAESDI